MRLRPSAKPYELLAEATAAEASAVPQVQQARQSFTVQRRATVVLDTQYNAEGQVTQRSYTDGRTQLLSWDGASRLVQVIEYHSKGTGDSEPTYAYRWSAVYDGLGRRLRTTTEWGAYASGAFAAGNLRPATTEDSWYDPAVEPNRAARGETDKQSDKIRLLSPPVHVNSPHGSYSHSSPG